MTQERWYAGVDWGSESHHVFLTDGDGRKIGEKIFKHSGEGLAEMAAWLMTASGADGPDPICVAIEVPHGPVVETLIERGFKVHAINPKQMDRFRDRFTLAGAKDDSRDAEVMASALRTDPRCFRLLAARGPGRCRAAGMVSHRRASWAPSATGSPIACASSCGAIFPPCSNWKATSAPVAARPVGSRADAQQSFAHPRRNRRKGAEAQSHPALRCRARAGGIAKATGQVAAGTVEAATAHIATLIARIRLVNDQIKQAHRQLDALTARLIPAEDAGAGQSKQHDVEILASLPGVGRIVLARLLTEAWDALQRRDYAALRSLTGVAPVTKRSGKSCIVIRRQACSPRLADAMYHWARVAIQHDPKSKAKYAALRGRGHSSWPRPEIGRRPPAQRRLRHAENRHHLQSLRSLNCPLLNGGESPKQTKLSSTLTASCSRVICFKLL